MHCHRYPKLKADRMVMAFDQVQRRHQKLMMFGLGWMLDQTAMQLGLGLMLDRKLR